jgi:phosphoribosylamine---glycine ligase
MSFFEKKRVLILGTTISNAAIVRILAENNPDITIDWGTGQDFKFDLPNVTVIKIPIEFTGTVDDTFFENKLNFFKDGSFDFLTSNLFNFVINNQDNYDMVIALTIDFQRWNKMSYIRNRLKIPVLTPGFQESTLEHDKLFTKDMLTELGIPTPGYKLVDKTKILEELDNLELPIVLKFSKGFSALGFGTWVFKKRQYQETIVDSIKAGDFLSQELYVEDFIKGKEVSVHYLCNGIDAEYMGSARDYKKQYEYDLGMNTSGIGCYSDVGYFTDNIKIAVDQYATQILKHLNSRGMFFRGVLYLGIIIGDDNIPQILEINTRPGSPEIVSILETVDCKNLLENFYRAATSDELVPFKFKNNAATTICLVNKSYNGIMKMFAKFPKLTNIPKDIKIDYSSYLFNKFNIYCSLTAVGTTRMEAAEKINKYLETQELNEFRFRKDIGFLE